MLQLLPIKTQQTLSFLNKLIKQTRAKLQLDHPCLLCDSLSSDRICKPCQHYLNAPRYTCQRCAIELNTYALMCGECLKKPPSFDETIACAIYQKPLNQLINEFKHKGNMVIGEAISQLFCQGITQHYRQQHQAFPDHIIAVPLHWKRHWQRGFNQSAFFSKALSKQLQIKEITSAKRLKATPTQEGLTRKQRLKNVKKSFTINQDLKGKSIAIVDDVMTTGATANSLAITLKQAGATTVSVWVFARTPKNT